MFFFRGYKIFFFSFIMVALVACMVDCSSDEDPMEEIVDPEPEVIVEPEPDWVDGVLTIEVGRFKTGTELLRALEVEVYGKREYFVGDWTRDNLTNPDFPMARRQYTIEIAVISMLEAGMNKPANMEEIKKHYKTLGYRPLTMEEAVELRLQFTDQPDISIGHKMADFFVLPSDAERDIQFKKGVTEKENIFNESLLTPLFVILKDYKRKSGDKRIYIQPNRNIQRGFRLFDPFHEPTTLSHRRISGARFACVISESNPLPAKTHD